MLSLLLQGVLTLDERVRDKEMLAQHHAEWKGGQAQPIVVHVIPHSHDDVGWLKTVDQYYYGARNDIQRAGVQYVIESVVDELSRNKDYRFSIVEMAFLKRWWDQANSTQRSTLQQLVSSGQIEILNGGWCMNDEANAYYEDIIDQMTTGLRWANETLGAIPSVGWHIDPFGHHNAQAALFDQMGFNAWFFARIDYQDKAQRLDSKRMETVWRPAGFKNQILSHVQYHHYSAPPGFNFDAFVNDQPIMDDPNLQGYNLDAKATQLVQYFQSMALHYRTSNLIHTFGQDFTYFTARPWYKNIDKLIKRINSDPSFNTTLVYSTPARYLEAIAKENVSYPLKTDDFFPYSDVEHGYWSGYYVSRTGLKGFIRTLGRWFQGARTYVALSLIYNTSSYVQANRKAIGDALFEMQTAIGILQHHDAISGTAKQAVTNDYLLIGCKGYSALNKHYLELKSEQAYREIGEPPSFFSCNWNATKSECNIHSLLSTNKTVIVQLYNPGAAVTVPVRLLVPARRLDVLDGNNAEVVGDIICDNTADNDTCSLLLMLTLGEQQNFYLKVRESSSGGSQVVKQEQIGVLEKDKTWDFGKGRGLYFQKKLQQFNYSWSASRWSTFLFSYEYYESYQGPGQKSGAYIFRPSNKTYFASIEYAKISKVAYFDGKNVLAVQLITDRLYSTLWFYKNAANQNTAVFDITTFVDEIPISDGQGKEIVMKIVSEEIRNNGVFYTDSSGLAYVKRILNYQEQYNLTVHQPVAGNYYPVNSLLQIVDKDEPLRRMTLLTDRSQGGTSLKNGTIQIMLQRRTTMDDARGVGEPLFENQTSGKGLTQVLRHKVIFDDSDRMHQKLWDQLPIPSYSITNTPKFNKNIPDNQRLQVPPGVKLYLRPNSDGTYLLRLHNTLAIAATVPVNLPGIKSFTETTLGGNQPLADWRRNRLQFRVDGEGERGFRSLIEESVGQDVAVGGGEIRTFLLQ